MSAIDAKQVMDLRRRTGLGIMDCKRALTVTAGDVEAAIDELRKAGALKAAKKLTRLASDGLLVTHVSAAGDFGLMAEINCETDFVARDDNFVNFTQQVLRRAVELRSDDVDEVMQGDLEEARQQAVQKLGENIALRRIALIEAGPGELGCYLHGNQRLGALVAVAGGDEALRRDLAMHIVASAPLVVAGEDMPEELLARERAIYLAQAEQSGKPAEIAEKMVNGRLRKFLAEHSLLQQPFVKDPDQEVGKLLSAAAASVSAFSRLEVGEGLTDPEAAENGATPSGVN